MPFLASFLLSFFGGLIGFFTKYLSKKLVMSAAVVAFFVSVSATLFAVLQAALLTIQFSLTNSYLATAMYMLWPAHLTICISVIFSARVAKWVAVETIERAKTVLYIT